MSSSASHLTRAVRRIDALAAERLPTQRLVEGVAEELLAAMVVDPNAARGGASCGR